jgi:hypothetical protein
MAGNTITAQSAIIAEGNYYPSEPFEAKEALLQPT